MTTILEDYQLQAKSCLSDLPWLAGMQQQAINDLIRVGFPKRQDEDWKYSSTVDLTKKAFLLASKSDSFLPDPDLELLGFLKTYPDFYFYNGTLQALPTLPVGVIALPLEEAFLQYPEQVKQCLGKVVEQEHGFQYLNTAFIQQGLFIYIPEGLVLETPLIIRHFQDKNQQAVYLRHLIYAEKNSQITIIEDFTGVGAQTYITNTLTEILVSQSAFVQHYKFQREAKTAYHLGHLAVRQLANSQFTSHSLSLGAKWARSDICINLFQEGAQCLMNGMYAPGDGQHVDHHTCVKHQAPQCTSKQDYKGVLMGLSRAVFNGKVVVAKDAQHTNAQQQNKNILLSKFAEVDTKPQLEIFADDVQCSHGATVGNLDEEAMFYLTSRGISPEDAKTYLIQAFLQNNVQLVPHQPLAAWMADLLIQQME